MTRFALLFSCQNDPLVLLEPDSTTTWFALWFSWRLHGSLFGSLGDLIQDKRQLTFSFSWDRIKNDKVRSLVLLGTFKMTKFALWLSCGPQSKRHGSHFGSLEEQVKRHGSPFGWFSRKPKRDRCHVECGPREPMSEQCRFECGCSAVSAGVKQEAAWDSGFGYLHGHNLYV